MKRNYIFDLMDHERTVTYKTNPFDIPARRFTTKSFSVWQRAIKEINSNNWEITGMYRKMGKAWYQM